MATFTTDGRRLFLAHEVGATVHVEGVGSTPAALGPLMGARLALSPTGDMAIAARIASGPHKDHGYASVNRGSWVSLGPTAQQQAVAWIDTQFVFARIGPGGASLIEQNAGASVLTTRPVSTSQGILTWDRERSWVIQSNSQTTKVGEYLLIKAVRFGDWWCGQATRPDRQVVVHKSGTPAYRVPGVQPETPQFVVLDGVFYAFDGRGTLHKGPFPIDVPGQVEPPPPRPTPPPPAPEPIEMPTWTEENRQLLLRFAAKFPIPKGVGEEAARNWTHKVCEQFRYNFGPAWGHKKADNGRPHSADAVAFKDGNKLYAWDVLADAGGPNCRLLDRPGTLDISNQVFEVVASTNHLEEVVPVPPPTPPPPAVECKFAPCTLTCSFEPAPPVDLTPIFAWQAKVDTALAGLAADNHKPRRLDGLRWVGTGTLSGVED